MRGNKILLLSVTTSEYWVDQQDFKMSHRKAPQRP